MKKYDGFESFTIVDRFDKQIAAVFDDDNGSANARLIAAAPELFRWLHECNEFLSGNYVCPDRQAGICDAVAELIERIGTRK